VLTLFRVMNGALLKHSRELLSYLREDVNAYIFIGAPRIPLYHVSTILRNFYIVTSKCDDIYVTKTARTLGILLDAKAVNLGNYLIAGVGGVDPWHSILRLRELLRNHQGKRVLLFSYFPAHGLCDSIPELSVRSGLPELRNLIDDFKPYVFVSLSGIDCVTRRNETEIHSISKNTSFLDLKFIP
jgi:hypothetical protein